MGRVLELAAEAVHRYEGTVNQYLGDGLMALFGAPVALEDHALRAVEAALTIQETIRGYSAQCEREQGVEIRLRVGLNTGEVVVGRIGDDLRMDYTAVGNTTNLASRVQSLADPGTILMSENTHRLVGGYVLSERLGLVEVKGQRSPVLVHRVTGRGRWRSRLELHAEVGLTRLVGRQRELALLHDRLRRAAAGAGHVVAIAGEPGLGKSRLLYEFRASLGEQPVDWLEGHCRAHNRAVPYVPILEILRTIFHIEEGDNPLQIQAKLRHGVEQLDPGLESTLPFLDSVLGLPGADDAVRHLEPKNRRQQTLEAIRAVVVARCRRRPHVLVCENLHWIDQSSEDFLDFLIGSSAAVPVLILTTHRPGYAARWADRAGYTPIALDRLAEGEMTEMLATLFGRRDFSVNVLRFIEEKAGGNPLFIEEVVHAMVERGVLVGEHGPLDLIGDPDIEFPATIQGIIQARVDRLDDPVKVTLQIGAVIGRDFDLRLLTRLSDTPAEIPGHLEILKRLELIHETRFFPRLEYRFRHAVIQGVVYKSLLGPRRQALHGAVARCVEDLYLEEHAAILAHHYAESTEPERAIKYALLAGDQAARLYANAEATAHYEQALTLAEALRPSPEAHRIQIDAILKRASVATTAEGVERDQAKLERARALAQALEDERRQAQVLYWLGRLAYVRGAFQTATGYAQQSLAIADRLGDEGLAAPPVNLMGRSYYLMGDYMAAAELLPRSVEQMQKLRNATEEATAAGFAGVTLAAIGEFERALSYGNHGLRLAQQLQNPFVEAAAFNYLAVAYCHQGAGAEAIANCQEARRVAERAGDRFRVYLVQFYEGQAYTMIGQPQRARELLEDSIGLARKLGTTTLLAWGQALLAGCLLALGEIDAVVPLCREALQLAEDTRDRLAKALAHRTLGEALAVTRAEDAHLAEEAMLEAIRIQQELGSRPERARSYVAYARLLQRWGRTADADRYLAEAMEMFRKMGMAHDLEAAQTALASSGDPGRYPRRSGRQ
jgi:predicted ATPase